MRLTLLKVKHLRTYFCPSCPMTRPPPPPLPRSSPVAPAPVPWSPSMGRRASPPVLGLVEDAGLTLEARTPAERQRLVQKHQHRNAVRAALRRAATAVAVAFAVGAGALWAPTQAWWSPAFLTHLPDPARMARWLLHPDLTALPGLSAQWNPWAALTLDEPDGLLTRWKISRLDSDPAACQAWLTAAPATDQTPLPAYTDPDTLLCGWKSASRIRQLDGVRFSSPFTLACGAAVSLARWERHTLQPAAHALLGSEVVRIDHLGSYACRPMGSGAKEQLSLHASANALDVAGFTLADGRNISVERDWRDAGKSPEQVTGERLDALGYPASRVLARRARRRLRQLQHRPRPRLQPGPPQPFSSGPRRPPGVPIAAPLSSGVSARATPPPPKSSGTPAPWTPE